MGGKPYSTREEKRAWLLARRADKLVGKPHYKAKLAKLVKPMIEAGLFSPRTTELDGLISICEALGVWDNRERYPR